MSSPTTPPWPSLYNPGLELNDIPHTAAVQPGGAYLYHAVDVFRFTLYWTLIFYTPIFLLCGLFAFWNLNCPPPAPAPPPRPSRMTTTTGVHLMEGPRSSTHPSRARTRSRNDGTWFSRSTDSYYTLSPLARTSVQQQQPEPSLLPPGSSMQAIPSTSTSFPTPFPSTAPLLSSHSPSTDAYPGLSRQHPNSTNNNIIKQGAAALSVSSSSLGPPHHPIPPPTRTKPKYKFKHHERRSRFTFALIVLFTFLAASLAGAVLSSAILGFVVAAFYRSVDYNMSTWIPFLLALIQVFVGFLSLWPSLIDVI